MNTMPNKLLGYLNIWLRGSSECLIDGGPSLCAGENSGCVLSSDKTSGLSSSCVESLEVCNPENFDGEEDSAVGFGDYLYIGCSIDQPWAFIVLALVDHVQRA